MHHFVLWSFVAVLAPLFLLAGAKYLFGIMVVAVKPVDRSASATTLKT
jgi:hypothetical protein